MTHTLHMDKELFIETIQQLQLQDQHDRRCHDAFSVILDSDYVSRYNNHWVVNQLVYLLQKSMNDDIVHSWIEYYIYELDFGKKYKPGMVIVQHKDVPLRTPEDLYNAIVFFQRTNTP